MGELDRGKEEHKQKLMEMFADVDPENCVLLALSKDGKTLHSYNLFDIEGFKKAVLTLMSDPEINLQIRGTTQFFVDLIGSCFVSQEMRDRRN